MADSQESQSICREVTHDFFQHSETLIAGFKCENEYIFGGVLLLAVVIVLAQNFISTKDGQASRQALTLPKKSKERDAVIRKLLMYTFVQSLLSTLHILLVVGLNLYVLLALMLGNLVGVWLSYRSQEQDKHDPSGDLCAILALVKEHPQDERLNKIKQSMQDWLLEDKRKAKCKDVLVSVTSVPSPLKVSAGSGTNIRSRYAPYTDAPKGSLDL